MTNFIKRFTEWILVKSNLDQRQHTPPWFNEGEIWWCSIGENVGVEISGKGKEFSRPVLVLRKLDKFSFMGVPLSTANRVGSWYINIKVDDIEAVAIISQIRHIDYRRVDNRMYVLSNTDFKRVKEGLINLISSP